MRNIAELESFSGAANATGKHMNEFNYGYGAVWPGSRRNIKQLES